MQHQNLRVKKYTQIQRVNKNISVAKKVKIDRYMKSNYNLHALTKPPKMQNLAKCKKEKLLDHMV